MGEFTAGLRLNKESVFSYQVKDAVELSYGLAVSLDDNDQIKLPAGDNDERCIGTVVTEEDVVGDDDDPQFVDVSTGSPSAPFVSQAAIGGGKKFSTKGTDGRVAESTTNPIGKANNTVGAADLRVWGNQKVG